MESQQIRHKRNTKIAKVLFVLLSIAFVAGIIAVIVTIKITPTTFYLSEYHSTSVSISVEDYDTLTFYVLPTTMGADDIELVVSDPSVAQCVVQDVRSVAEKKLIIVGYQGLSVGETTLYIKDKSSDSMSEIIHLSVHEKATDPEDNSRTVYLNYDGDKYHYDENCAGKTAYESTLNQAIKFGKEPCSKCAK